MAFDDIIIFSKYQETHFKDIEIIFDTLSKANLKVQLDKCDFLKPEVELLGFIISSHGLKTNPKKVESIINFPAPKTLKDLRSFLGLSGFYRRFIRDYAKLAKPLTALLRGEDGHVYKNRSKNMQITLNEEALTAFDRIKLSLTTEDIILNYPDFTKPIKLTTDASNHAIRAVLSQNDRPIVFISRRLSEAEENYATDEKEMLGIIWSLNNLRNYLYGSRKVQIFTDHQPLTYALSNKNNNKRMKRWKAILQEYNYELYYKPGKAHVVADALSRLPQINHLANSENDNNSLSETIHSDISSSHHLIPIAQEPINVFKNQIFLKIEETSSYQFQIIFPTYHGHIITKTEFNQQNLINLLKRYLNPSVINGLHTDENTLGKILETYPIYFSNHRVRFKRNIVKDLRNEIEQDNDIIKEHKRAHRNGRENKAQILRNFYFPQMQAKIDGIIKQCKICKEQKYERHPTKPLLQSTPIPHYPGQIVHLNIYHTHIKVILTAINKFS